MIDNKFTMNKFMHFVTGREMKTNTHNHQMFYTILRAACRASLWPAVEFGYSFLTSPGMRGKKIYYLNYNEIVSVSCYAHLLYLQVCVVKVSFSANFAVNGFHFVHMIHS